MNKLIIGASLLTILLTSCIKTYSTDERAGLDLDREGIIQNTAQESSIKNNTIFNEN